MDPPRFALYFYPRVSLYCIRWGSNRPLDGSRVLVTLSFSSPVMVYGAPGTRSGPRRFLYLLYGFYSLYFNLWQV
jgi:hypothetical protein